MVWIKWRDRIHTTMYKYTHMWYIDIWYLYSTVYIMQWLIRIGVLLITNFYNKDIAVHRIAHRQKCIIKIRHDLLVVLVIATNAVIILDMGSTNVGRRYNVTSSLIGWAHFQYDPCEYHQCPTVRPQMPLWLANNNHQNTAWTKWPRLCQRRFKIHFRCKLLCLDSNTTAALQYVLSGQ